MQDTYERRNDESYIGVSDKGITSYVGPDATNLFRAKTMYSALGLLKVGISPNRLYTPTKVLAIVSEYTGKKYKRGQYDTARADLKVWIDTRLSTLPIKRRD